VAVRVRLFAALREAAGTGEDVLAPGPLPALLEVLRQRHGQRFADVLAICTVLVDGSAVSREATVDVPDGAELALLPPVSGGA
jgi:sulfur-carrier protein